MLQRLSIRGKILAVVAVPIIVLLLAVGVVTLSASQTLNNARNVEQLLGTLDKSRGFVQNLQTERNLSVNYVDAVTDGAKKREDAQSTTDAAVAALNTEVTENPTPEGETALKKVNTLLNRTQPGVFLADLRAIDVSSEELGDWLTFPDAADVAANAEGYAAVATAIEEVNNATPVTSGIKSELTSLSFAVGFEGTSTEKYLTEPVTFQTELIAARPQTDTAQSAFSSQVADIDPRTENAAVLKTLAEFDEQLAQLSNVRIQVVNRTVSVSVLTNYYTSLIEPLVKTTSDVASVVTDQTLASQLRGYRALDTLVERVRSEEVFTDHLLRAGVFLPGDSTFQRSLVALSDIALVDAQDSVEPLEGIDEVPEFAVSSIPSDGDSSSFESIRNNVASGLEAALVTERANDWPLQVSQELAVQIPIRDQIWEAAQGSSADTLQATVLQTILTVVGAILVVVATIFIALVIARRIIGPLRRLTTTATAVQQELPRMVERVALPGEQVDVSEVQIPVESSDEIGRLAEAFNGVNAATLAIAGEQAALRGSISEMFVNVARRDQVLLNRQLSSIDEMERTEDNPDTLTRLFALDHLATRMRRNSESLLVLAGIDTGRRLRRPMPLSDVIRTASSEIELYERVQLELDADPAMVGHSALTAAHLFAELLENATVFSDPGSPVVVRTLERDGDFIVEVEDTGIGMTLDELREANNRVASTAASEILGAQRLGLFVVGRIARRVGARVSITSKEGAGTTATITMPATLFDTRESDLPAHVSTTAVDSSVNAPVALVSHNVTDEVIDNATQPDATRRPSAPGYQPATVESGASLVGRPDDTAEPAADSVADLIAADAAVAPEATAVDSSALDGGLTASGLPARRRRAGGEAAATSEDERAKIIGLPARATPDQLSALDAESPSGFTPTVSAEEIAPQSAEERASMFRGFRSRKSAEEDHSDESSAEAESMGQAVRRGAYVEPAGDGAQGQNVPEVAPADAPRDEFVVPLLEDDEGDRDDRHPGVDSASPPPVEEGYSAFAMPKFTGDGAPPAAATPADVTPADGAHDAPDQPAEPWAVPMLEDESPREAAPEPAEDAPMVIPSFAQDEVPTDDTTHQRDSAADTHAPSPEDVSTPAVKALQQPVAYEQPQQPQQPQQPHQQFESPSHGVEQVSLDTGPTFREPEQAAPTPPTHQLNPSELAALTSTPSMDELMSGEGDDDKPNFFSRLFGRGKKSGEADAPTVAPAASAPSPYAPSPSYNDAPVAPEPRQEPAQPGFEPNPAFEPKAAPAPADFAPDRATPPASSPTHSAGVLDNTEPAAPAPITPTPHVQGPISLHEAPPVDDAPWHTQRAAAPVAPTQPESPVVPPASGGSAASFFAPRQDDAPQQGHFSPDDLANPVGWEAAGASALQAAGPEVQTSYTPKVDLDSEQDAAPDLSSVFSEFSSLSSQRPKVEKTRAGLQKRRAVDAPPVEVKPIEEEVVVAPRNRDADAVRSRFSSFYSGTQRARSDAAEFERSQTADEN